MGQNMIFFPKKFYFLDNTKWLSVSKPLKRKT